MNIAQRLEERKENELVMKFLEYKLQLADLDFCKAHGILDTTQISIGTDLVRSDTVSD